MIINPFSENWYIPYGSANVWHNPTSLFSKFFSIILFIQLLKINVSMEQGTINLKDLIKLSALSILSMWSKPSFLLSFLPALTFLYSIRFIKGEISLKNMLSIIVGMSLSLIPAILIYFMTYGSVNSGSSIIFKIHSIWTSFDNNILYNSIISSCFLIFFYFFSFKYKKSSFSISLSFINFIFAIFIYYSFIETGFRETNYNLIWTYNGSLFLSFFSAVD